MAPVSLSHYSTPDTKIKRRLWISTIGAFICAAGFSIVALVFLGHYHLIQARVKATGIAQAHVRSLDGSIAHALSATYALAALVRQGNGSVAGFERLATEMRELYPGVGALQLAPNGVISHCVPLEGNERAIGHDLLKDPQRTKEAFLARDSGKLTLAGPFELVQGGIGAAGRLPIYLPTPSGEARFWGFSSVLIRFPEVLHAAGLPDLAKGGYEYELWRVHPDSGQRQVISSSGAEKLESPVELPFDVPNGRWILAVAPASGWTNLPLRAAEAAVAVVVSLGIALLVHILLRQPVRLGHLVDERTRELVESVERVRLLLDSTAEAIYGIDLSGRCTFVNRSALKMLGFDSEAALLGSHIHDRIHSRLPDGSSCPLEECPLYRTCLEGESIYCESDTLWRADGSSFPIEYWSFPIRDAGGKVVGAVVTFLDISERLAHKRREDAFNKVFQILPDRFFHLRGDGVILRYRDRGFIDESDGPVGSPIQDILPVEACESITAAIQRAIRSRDIAKVEYAVARQEGDAWFEMRLAPLDGCDELIAVVRDITEVKHLEAHRLEMERRLLHAQKLESLGVLAGGIAHDFNNLLTAIIGNLDVAMMRMTPDGVAQLSIERSMLACRKAADLTRQMLAYSGKAVFQLQAVDLNTIVCENRDLFRTVVPRNVSLLVETAQNLPPIVADPSQIQQVVMNLITNAAEAIGTSPGAIRLSTGTMVCDEEFARSSWLDYTLSSGSFVYLEVMDNGCGMDKETQSRLYEPFFSTKFAGRGLGMAATQGIVKAHKGAIILESEPQKGSRFRVLFPASEDGQVTFIDRCSDQTEGFPVITKPCASRALIVDDDEMVRSIAVEYLRLMGWDSLEARDGLEALEVFSKHSHEIGVAIVDLTMPNMDGVATFHELKKIRPDLLVILSSGFSGESVVEKFSDTAPEAFLQKPFKLSEMKEIIPPIRGAQSC